MILVTLRPSHATRQILPLLFSISTGEIPKGLGLLTQVKYVNLGTNRLFGSIPDEIGQLSNLRLLTAYHNRLSGGIPPQLALCSYLTHLDLSQNGFSGDTSILQQFQKLEFLDLSYNQFSGAIFNTLQSMASLKIADLRKNSLIDIPSSISANLTYLDLAFNQITASLPKNFGGQKLQYLFMDHNNLNGEVPDASFISMFSLRQLDLSHNLLKGSTKFTTYLGKAERNLGFNYLSDDSIKPFDCSFLSPTALDQCSPSIPGDLENIAINAGGYDTVFKDMQFHHDVDKGFGLHYDSDGSRTWAVEISKQFKTIIRPDIKSLAEIYESMRTSEEFLAYHGTRLRAGTYNVTLYFAEIEEGNVRYRVFDVYIQGILVYKDLDVAFWVRGNASYVLSYETEVKSGIVSVQLLFEGRARGDKYYKRGGPMISAISVTLTKAASNRLGPLGLPVLPAKAKSAIISIVIAVVAILAYCCCLLFALWRRKKRQEEENEQPPTQPQATFQRSI